MSDHLWYYELLNETHGPVSTDEMQQMVADGQLTEDDRIRPETSQDWITVTDLKSLVENVASGEDEWEEVTDLDDLNFTFEESSAGVSRAAENLDEIDDRHSELDIDSLQLVGDAEQARHSAFDAVTNKSTDAEWMVRSLGEVLGPLATAQLVSMAESGSLAGSDGVRKQNHSDWTRADSIPEVATALGIGKTSETRKPSSRKRRPSSESDARNSTGRKRRRKKKRSKKDQLLAEIFADVFAEDGQVRDMSERPDLAKPSAPAAFGGNPNHGGSPNGGGMANPAPPIQPAMGGPGNPMAASPGMPASQATAASHPAFTAPAKTKKRGGGGGTNFSMPEPPVLAAIAGGLLVVVLGYAAFAGWISLPGFGTNPSALFAKFEGQFSGIVTKELPPEEWESFRTTFIKDARAVARAHTSTAGTNPESAKILNKSLLIVRLLEIPQENTESRESTWTKYKQIK